MKSAFYTLLAAFALFAVTGCSQTRNFAGACPTAPEPSPSYGPVAGPYAGPVNPGPPMGAVAYPYYTLHGPRDFLARCPRSIGP